jgi:hypothetical protein
MGAPAIDGPAEFRLPKSELRMVSNAARLFNSSLEIRHSTFTPPAMLERPANSKPLANWKRL